MKIQIASDLHLEFLAPRFPGHIGLAPTHADVLVLAGDIADGAKAPGLFQDWPVPILYTAGNHEYYNHTLEQVDGELAGAAPPFYALQMHQRVLPDKDGGSVRFLGATAWTDFRLFGENLRGTAMRQAAKTLNDYRCIGIAAHDHRALRPADTADVHATHVAWLRARLAESFVGKTVVVTHMAPSMRSVAARYASDLVSAAFSSPLDDLVTQADLWIHGHTHDSFDYRLGKCRVVCNPRGYPANARRVDDPAQLRFENAAFHPALVVEV